MTPPSSPPQWQPPSQPSAPSRRRWPVWLAAGVVGAVVAGAVTVGVTLRLTAADPGETPVEQTVTVTAEPPPPPAPLPVEQADAKTCAAWHSVRQMVTDAVIAQSVIPEGLDILSPQVQTHPEWKAGVAKSSRMFREVADLFDERKPDDVDSMLGHVSDTTVNALRTVSTAYAVYAPESGNAAAVFREAEKTMDWLCQ